MSRTPTGGRQDTGRGRDRGSVSVEVAILAPAFFALIALAGVAGRTAIAAEAIESAAHDAARAASISRDPVTARSAAADAARVRLDWSELDCTEPPALRFTGSVGGRTAPFDAAFGTTANQSSAVSVRVTCVVSFADFRLPGMPGMPVRRAVSAEFTSPLDRYRSRG
ncbi:TadE/TadG family type IV pilus assembly protein [Micromonospora sp. SH-82]|uniref:TadE/TadG family type IV pilus assembly protein n=1 Tax=Micromonospora sp. SH-82 TaxID=3132938 RepID=UPI003EBA24B8